MQLKAVIFDMDGVLMDSEDLWRKAMKEAFANYGFKISESECKSTMGMRIAEVIRHWLFKFQPNADPVQIEQDVMAILLQLIEKEGQFIDGIPGILNFLDAQKIPFGVATSSSNQLMDAILTKLAIRERFKALSSAENMPYGKPHPDVFIDCASKLKLDPRACLVIEDSLNGVIAGKAARMTVIAVPDQDNSKQKGFSVADYQYASMREVLPLLQTIFGHVN